MDILYNKVVIKTRWKVMECLLIVTFPNYLGLFDKNTNKETQTFLGSVVS